MNQDLSQEQRRQYDDTYGFLCYLARISDREWRRILEEEDGDSSSTLRETYYKLIGDNAFHPLNDAVHDLLRNEHMRIPPSRPKRGRILLPPIDRESRFVPLLSVEWDFSERELTGYGFKLDMMERGHRLLSIRFERGAPRSDHDFLHVQANDSSEGLAPKNDISWFCCRKPCLPLNATQRDSPVFLLILLYASLYGFDRFVTDFHGAGVRREYYREIEPFRESR